MALCHGPVSPVDLDKSSQLLLVPLKQSAAPSGGQPAVQPLSAPCHGAGLDNILQLAESISLWETLLAAHLDTQCTLPKALRLGC